MKKYAIYSVVGYLAFQLYGLVQLIPTIMALANRMPH
jgi:hypothetical protein